MASKRCSKCRVVKPLTEFTKDASGHSRDGLKYHCKRCAIEYTNNWKRNNPVTRKLSNRKTKVKLKYGATPETIRLMLEAQNFTCAVCPAPISFSATSKKQKPHIDHCHDTGVVRGLLCLTCNTGLGMFQDSRQLLLAAMNYLDVFGQRERLSEPTPSSEGRCDSPLLREE